MSTIEKQLEIENGAAMAGRRRYFERLEVTRPENSGVGQRLVGAALENTTQAIREWVEQCKAGKANRAATRWQFVEMVGVERMAAITCRVVVNALTSEGRTLTWIASTIGRFAEASVQYDEIAKQAPGLARRMADTLKRNDDEEYRVVCIKRAAKWADLKVVRWGDAQRVEVGHQMVALFCEATGLASIRLAETSNSDKVAQRVVPAEGVMEWLAEEHLKESLAQPVYQPCVIEPQRWTSLFDGGFYTAMLRKPLVKKQPKRILRDINGSLRAGILDTVNRMQATQWQVNREVLDVAYAAVRSGIDLGWRSRPTVEADKPLPQGDEKSTKRALAKWHGKVQVAKNKDKWRADVLGNHADFAEFEALHFVWEMDWRGRLYPVSTYLNPQGTDLQKGLLRFARGEKLGNDGAFWLSVHLANNYVGDEKLDKAPYEARVEWVEAHSDDIERVVRDPLGEGLPFLATAENPWQFLAAAYEFSRLQGWIAQGGLPSEFVSTLPVGMDGTCNGIQQFAALLKDAEAGALVGLVPTQAPADIYSRVAEESNHVADTFRASGDLVVCKEAAEYAEDTAEWIGEQDFAALRLIIDSTKGLGPDVSPVDLPSKAVPVAVLAEKWAGNITRKMAKRNTMTRPYGSVQHGMTEQMAEFLNELAETTSEAYTWADAYFVARCNFTAIDRVVKSASDAMRFLRKVGSVVSETGEAISWFTPMGLKVTQRKLKFASVRGNYHINGVRFQPRLMVTTKEIDKRAQADGISPNFIHSLDAAHLMRTVRVMGRLGVKDFAMVHDSYGVHAGNVETMHKVLRWSFVKQYRGDILGNLRAQIAAQLPEKLAAKLPMVPPMGSLDIEAVKRSPYFFA